MRLLSGGPQGSAQGLFDIEINRYADPTVLGDIALFGRDKTPEFDCCQGCVIKLLAAAAFLDLHLARLAAGQNMYPQHYAAFPAATHGQRGVLRCRIIQVARTH